MVVSLTAKNGMNSQLQAKPLNQRRPEKKRNKMESIGTRMKNNYEDRYRLKLTRRIPCIIRLDGKAFHTLSKNCERPFDSTFSELMSITAKFLCENIQGTKCAYVQSDEISILLIDYDRITTQAWFDYNVQKMVSVSAAMASVFFTRYWNMTNLHPQLAIFDARCFNMPIDEVCNYFIWRQKDWERNSIQMLARAHFSHKELQGKNSNDMHEILHEKCIHWGNLEQKWKSGIFVCCQDKNWTISSAPIFTQDRSVIDNLLGRKD